MPPTDKEISCRVTRTLLMYLREQNQDSLGALLEGLEVALGLGGEDDAESVRVAGDGEVRLRRVGDLDEETVVAVALVKLAGGMQEARAPAAGDGEAETVAEALLHLLELGLAGGGGR